MNKIELTRKLAGILRDVNDDYTEGTVHRETYYVILETIEEICRNNGIIMTDVTEFESMLEWPAYKDVYDLYFKKLVEVSKIINS